VKFEAKKIFCNEYPVLYLYDYNGDENFQMKWIRQALKNNLKDNNSVFEKQMVKIIKQSNARFLDSTLGQYVDLTNVKDIDKFLEKLNTTLLGFLLLNKLTE